MIVVDIQPAYQDSIGFLDQFVDHYNKQTKKVLFFFNGPAREGESKQNVIEWLLNQGVAQETISNTIFYQKDYGFIRDGLDSFSYLDVYAVLKYMVENDQNHTRELTNLDIENLRNSDIDQSFVDGIAKKTCKLNVRPDIIKLLKLFDGHEIIGGKADRCLLEIVCLMDAFGLKYIKNKKLIYS